MPGAARDPHDLGWRYGRLPRTDGPEDEDLGSPHARTASLDWFVGGDHWSEERFDPAHGPRPRSGRPGRALAAAGRRGPGQGRGGDAGPPARSCGPAPGRGRDRGGGDRPRGGRRGRHRDGLARRPAAGRRRRLRPLLAAPPRGLGRLWTDESGSVGPLSAGLSDPRVEVVGTWPTTAIHATFRWARRPGVRLRRVLALYDELSRAEEPEYADIHIMENLDTGCVPSGPALGAELLDL